MESASRILHLLLPCLVLFFTVAVNASTPVLDTHGNPLRKGVRYYVRTPQVRGVGNLGWAGSECPLNVVLKSYPYGPAVMLFPDGDDMDIVVGQGLSIMFAEPPPCNLSTTWTVRETTGFVTIGGVRTPASENSYSRFRITRYPIPEVNVYQLRSCSAPTTMEICNSIGVQNQQLQKSDEVIAVSFIKVDT